jgi:hypothetical protein
MSTIINNRDIAMILCLQGLCSSRIVIPREGPEKPSPFPVLPFESENAGGEASRD